MGACVGVEFTGPTPCPVFLPITTDTYNTVNIAASSFRGTNFVCFLTQLEGCEVSIISTQLGFTLIYARRRRRIQVVLENVRMRARGFLRSWGSDIYDANC